MSNVSLQVDQGGYEIQGVLGQPLQAPINFAINAGAVLIQLVPGRVYELTCDGIASYLFGDAGMAAVTATSGRFTGILTPIKFKVEPDAPYLSIIAGPATIFTGSYATIVELR